LVGLILRYCLFCKTRYSYAHPTISPDGKAIYFIANIKGGKEATRGSSDIFRVKINDDNTYGSPKNLGTKVNSYSREMFPFISKDNILYFSSNRPNGAGGYDIYKSVMNEDGSFEKAKLLPKPLNSNKDDFCFIIDENNTGYLTSKRTGGKGDDDIYYFTKE
jgi:Tol biopolymer transport system component